MYVFRTDASLQIGSGHVMRCLTLANALRERGAECHFLCRAHSGHLGARIKAAGHRLTLLDAGDADWQPSDNRLAHAAWLGTDWQDDARQTISAIGTDQADWLIVDHYTLDAAWERELRPHAKRIMIIDDLADRRHDCDLVLDQNLGRTEADYADLVPARCKMMIGPRYALLRPEFAQWREYSLVRRGDPQLKEILISMGGMDPGNATGQVLDILQFAELPADCRLAIVMGGEAPWLDSVRKQAAKSRWPCEVQVDVMEMARLMADSDLAIGAGGSTSWERCCLGLPSLLILLAKNQHASARMLVKAKAGHLLGELGDIVASLPEALAKVTDRDVIARMSVRAASICDGHGTERSLDCIITEGMAGGALAGICHVRPMIEEDLEAVLVWRNHPDIRRYMCTRHEISPEEHKAWFERAIHDHAHHLLIVEENSLPLGFVGFKARDEGMVDWGFYAVPNAPKGTGRKLGLAALEYAFGQLGFSKVCGQALAFNENSIALHRALGFTEEGILNGSHIEGDIQCDIHCFGLLAKDWQQHN